MHIAQLHGTLHANSNHPPIIKLSQNLGNKNSEDPGTSDTSPITEAEMEEAKKLKYPIVQPGPAPYVFH